MKKILISLLAIAVFPVIAMADCPTPTTATATVTLKRVIPGLLDGNFSVSSTKKVQFSQGNLQYNSDEQKWQFATNQWDYIGNTTGNTNITVDGKANNTGVADLFGWVGASSTWTGLAQNGLSSSKVTNSTNSYGNDASEDLKSDWGSLMGTGWRTLTRAEWTYLLNTTSSSDPAVGRQGNRYAKARVHSVNGLILLPDGWTQAASKMEGTLSGINSPSADYSTVSDANWTKLANEGCVFLPAAGLRYGTDVSNAGSRGLYWSSSPYPSSVTIAYAVDFYSTALVPNYAAGWRSCGYSVRLVRVAQ